MTIRIAMWSGPRNISTAMMRSFGARSDCAVCDEPFYGAFLKSSGEDHPMGVETMASMDCDWESVLRTQSGPIPDGKHVWYQKHMPHHMVGPIDLAQMPDHKHAFLIRAPERVVASYKAKNELRSPELLGFAQVREYFEREADRLGKSPPVIDSDGVLANPAGVLQNLCLQLGILWDPAMLSWEKGPHQADGVWGAHWYDRVNSSTQFGQPRGALPKLDGAYQKTVDACREDYDFMAQYAIAP
ncbi:MAG: HAD family hydrolase [Pseudomonadota bacterium]